MLAKFKKILVGLDGSKNSLRALTKAIVLVKSMHIPITGIFVVQSYSNEMGMKVTMRGKTKTKEYKNFISKVKSKCKKNKIKFSEVVVYGEEGRKIVSYAEKNKFNLIVIGSRGMSSVKENFLGSTSNYVMHKSKIPVLIVK